MLDYRCRMPINLLREFFYKLSIAISLMFHLQFNLHWKLFYIALLNCNIKIQKLIYFDKHILFFTVDIILNKHRDNFDEIRKYFTKFKRQYYGKSIFKQRILASHYNMLPYHKEPDVYNTYFYQT